MNCIEAKQVVRILLMPGGTNPPRELAEHLRECRACEARFAPLLAMASELQRLQGKELPADFDARFRRRLARRMQQEGKKARKSAFLFLAANDEFRWVLVLALGVGPVAAALGDAVVAPPRPLQISASNIGVMALGLLFAAAFVQAVLHSDIIMEIFRRKRI